MRSRLVSTHRHRTVVLLGAILLSAPTGAGGQTPTSIPSRVSWDVAVGGSNALQEVQPVLATGVTVRVGAIGRVAAFVSGEVSVFGSGYVMNVGLFRPDGSEFTAIRFLEGAAISGGVALAPTRMLQLRASAGLLHVVPLGRSGPLVQGDVAVPVSRRVAVVGAVRRAWYYDTRARSDRTFTPLMLGVRVGNGS